MGYIRVLCIQLKEVIKYDVLHYVWASVTMYIIIYIYIYI